MIFSEFCIIKLPLCAWGEYIKVGFGRLETGFEFGEKLEISLLLLSLGLLDNFSVFGPKFLAAANR